MPKVKLKAAADYGRIGRNIEKNGGETIMSDIMVIGIAGGTGSGKTTITRRLVERFGEDVSVIHHDNYYKAHHDMPFEERVLLNYDHPNAFDTDMLIEHLKLLKQGQSIRCPVYDYSIHDRTDNTTTIKPKSFQMGDSVGSVIWTNSSANI